MKQLRDSLPARIAAWLLLLASLCAGAFFGQQALFAAAYTWNGDWTTTTAFAHRLEDRKSQVWDCLQYTVVLKGDGLNYVEREQYASWLEGTQAALSPEHTNFRFQVLSDDGSEVSFSNLEADKGSLEEQVSEVFYGTVEIQDGSVHFGESSPAGQAWAQADQGVASPSSTLESGVLRYGILRPESFTAQDEFSDLYALCTAYGARFSLYGGLCAVFGALALLALVFLVWSAGHRAGAEGIVLSWPHRVFTEAWVLLFGLGAILFVFIFCEEYYYTFYGVIVQADRDWIWFLAGLGAAAVGAMGMLLAGFLNTLAVRVKARALARTTLLYRVVSFLWRRLSAFVRELPFTWKAVLSFLAYLAAIWCVDHIWPLPYWYPIPGVLINVAVLLLLAWWTASFWKVRKGTQVIAAGNLNHQIDTDHLPGDLKRQAEALNNISGGLTQAVNEQMKSERFKAELITNVSHDLKTPLTSIINYVNLLKTTQQSDPQAREYIEVLDRKSQRLKKLTEDLVEASKASTGALSVNREKIGMVQLLDQALGEYEERLEKRRLTVVRTLPDGECYVYADGRHLWRVMDNLLSNCAKYALEGTRVYVEILRGKGSVSLSVKNISREPLNVPPERLLERFVRGDESRTTEGSGLGLSIAKSLTELQGGTFHLVVDGDLFKAVVTLPQAS